MGPYSCDLWQYSVRTGVWNWINTDPGTLLQQQEDCPGILQLNESRAFPGARVFFGFERYYSETSDGGDDFLRLFGGRGYAVGGSDGVYLNDVWDFNLTSLRWSMWSIGNGSEFWEDVSDNGTIPGGRATAGVWSVGSLLYVHGGDCDLTSELNTSMTWVFNSSSVDEIGSHWTPLYPVGELVSVFSTSACWKNPNGSTFYCFGRDPHDGLFRPRLSTYNVLQNSWSEIVYSSLPQPAGDPQHPSGRFDAMAFCPPLAPNGTCYYLGGKGLAATLPLNPVWRVIEMWSYDPDLEPRVRWNHVPLTDDGDDSDIHRWKPLPDPFFWWVVGYGRWGGDDAYLPARYSFGVASIGRTVFLHGGWLWPGFAAAGADMWVLEFPCEDPSMTGCSCNEPICEDGNSIFDPLVCSGRGSCNISVRACQCQAGWGSPFCDVYFCDDGHLVNDPSRCSGHGSCTETDRSCSCFGNWSGIYCSVPACFGIVSGDVAVCSAHGSCVGNDNCTCWSGWGGLNCGTSSSDPVGPTSAGAIVGGVLGTIFVIGLILLLVVVAVVIVCVVLKKKRTDASNQDELEETPKWNRLTDSAFIIPFKNLRLVETIGSGGGGAVCVLAEFPFPHLIVLEVVYRAEWKHKVVAFKLFSNSTPNAAPAYDEFEKEVAVMSSLSHPNILQFFGVSLKKLGIVMEHCSNGDLSQAIAAGSLASNEQKLGVLKGIASGMDYLHMSDIIHRDLKPQNVLLDDHLCPKIMDFGLSRMKDEGLMTRGVGTAIYMAPELTLGQTYGSSVDVFSFGILTAVVMSCVRNPYPSVAAHAIQHQVATDPTFRPAALLPSDYPDLQWLSDLMKRCWCHDPLTRPSFEVILDSLENGVCPAAGPPAEDEQPIDKSGSSSSSSSEDESQ